MQIQARSGVCKADRFMDMRRPALTATPQRDDSGVSDEECAPSTQRKPNSFVDKDETLGLTKSVTQALELASESADLANEARDANDDELAEFFEHCQRQATRRAEQAKLLLEARLRQESEPPRAPHAAEARAHCASTADEDPESVRVR